MSPAHVAVFDFSSKLERVKAGGGTEGKQFVLVLAPGLGQHPGPWRLGGELDGTGGAQRSPWSSLRHCLQDMASAAGTSHIFQDFFFFLLKLGISCHLSGSHFPHLKKWKFK